MRSVIAARSATPMPVYLDGVHGADEAIDVADLAAMTDFNLEAIRALGG